MLFLWFSLNTNLSIGGDTISWNGSLSIGQTITSSGGTFELGFFQPGSSSKYYIGIWYKNITLQTIVWVANRETPVEDAAELTISQGNLVLVDKFRNPIWSALSGNVNWNISVTAILHDDGNLILSEKSNSSTPLLLWQSFDYPTHTFLPGAKLGYDKRTQRKQVLISWKDLNDPAPGLYSVELDPWPAQFVIKWNRTTQYWASGSWNGRTFSSVPELTSNNIFNFSYIDNENESYFTYSLYDSTFRSRLIMDVSGQIKQLSWLDTSNAWNLFWSQPIRQCEMYAYCGAFGICNHLSCNCLSGFKPRSESEWNSNDYSGGCVREEKLQCHAVTEDKDSFWMNSITGLPASQDTNFFVREASECRSTCFNSCSCTAYTYDGGFNCSIWTSDLFNLQQFSRTGRTIFVKRGSPQALLPAPTKAKKPVKLKAILSSIAAFVFLILGSFSYIYYIRRRRRRADRINGTQGVQISHWHKVKGEAKVLINENNDEAIDVPYFQLETILAATDNFSNANKLGQGGFGPVYKGIFPGEKEIAVKKLSSHSGQGIDEFKNEVTLIAKLQHRNLVRLLGYCINATEQIILYEFMPNKSLDTFIFGLEPGKKPLSWCTRLKIAAGAAHGLEYLHCEANPPVIYRDLKSSNILLDNDFNPKLSDFGLAKLGPVGENTHVSTRVMGTYGYCAPEYAMSGKLTLKSDIYSLGVVLLELITGRKAYDNSRSAGEQNLVVWSRPFLKDRRKFVHMVDPLLNGQFSVRSLHHAVAITAMCIQEQASFRPIISDIVVALDYLVSQAESSDSQGACSQAGKQTLHRKEN